MRRLLLAFVLASFLPLPALSAQVAVRGETVYTMAGPPLKDGVVLVVDGKITAVGPAAEVAIPAGFKILKAKVVTPGLIDAHTVLGLSGILNQKQDQDQLEHSAPLQPDLRAVDAYNPQDELIPWVRGFGVTTVHTGHAPGELISGQTMIAKTTGNSVGEAVRVSEAALAVTLAQSARKSDKKSPGTRAKMMAMLRQELVKAQEYLRKRETEEGEKKPARDLKLENLAKVLQKKIPLMITADRAQDIENALRLAREFGFRLWLDSAAEAYLLVEPIKKAGVPVILHPTMARSFGDRENLSFETASVLMKAGIPVAIQGGYESYVPKVRVVLYEAAVAAGHGLTFEQALSTITIGAARILGIADKVGSLESGKDGDLALYDGDPFEYTSHCIGVVIEGRVVSDRPR